MCLKYSKGRNRLALSFSLLLVAKQIIPIIFCRGAVKCCSRLWAKTYPQSMCSFPTGINDISTMD